MPKILRARRAQDEAEEQKIRMLAGARHAPADWIERARMVELSWDGLGVPAIAERLGCHQEGAPLAAPVQRPRHRPAPGPAPPPAPAADHPGPPAGAPPAGPARA